MALTSPVLRSAPRRVPSVRAVRATHRQRLLSPAPAPSVDLWQRYTIIQVSVGLHLQSKNVLTDAYARVRTRSNAGRFQKSRFRYIAFSLAPSTAVDDVRTSLIDRGWRRHSERYWNLAVLDFWDSPRVRTRSTNFVVRTCEWERYTSNRNQGRREGEVKGGKLPRAPQCRRGPG